jgi:hypothetical protein
MIEVMDLPKQSMGKDIDPYRDAPAVRRLPACALQKRFSIEATIDMFLRELAEKMGDQLCRRVVRIRKNSESHPRMAKSRR